MKKEKFKNLYFSMTNQKLSKQLNISEKTLIKYARSLGLKKRNGMSNGNKPKIKFTD